jgi:hypothetical protein
MERAEALKTLRLDATADGGRVESAYWQLVRQAQQQAADDVAAQREIDHLNQARDVLAPKGAPPAPRRAAVRRAESNAGDIGIAMLETVADWVWAEALRTRMRWPGRTAELAIIGGAAIVLMVLALGAGASAWWTFAVVGVLLTSIWAPWRKV